ncbi:MAG: hypothetical protein HON43_00440 [Alphaproteobacteria bacterium]|nr:hypothetical protein [Alphaproteobacteria bacterium]MBT5389538.1 hypothetical protein [Alphaproteobacteria bacterium]
MPGQSSLNLEKSEDGYYIFQFQKLDLENDRTLQLFGEGDHIGTLQLNHGSLAIKDHGIHNFRLESYLQVENLDAHIGGHLEYVSPVSSSGIFNISTGGNFLIKEKTSLNSGVFDVGGNFSVEKYLHAESIEAQVHGLASFSSRVIASDELTLKARQLSVQGMLKSVTGSINLESSEDISVAEKGSIRSFEELNLKSGATIQNFGSIRTAGNIKIAAQKYEEISASELIAKKFLTVLGGKFQFKGNVISREGIALKELRELQIMSGSNVKTEGFFGGKVEEFIVEAEQLEEKHGSLIAKTALLALGNFRNGGSITFNNSASLSISGQFENKGNMMISGSLDSEIHQLLNSGSLEFEKASMRVGIFKNQSRGIFQVTDKLEIKSEKFINLNLVRIGKSLTTFGSSFDNKGTIEVGTLFTGNNEYINNTGDISSGVFINLNSKAMNYANKSHFSAPYVVMRSKGNINFSPQSRLDADTHVSLLSGLDLNFLGTLRQDHKGLPGNFLSSRNLEDKALRKHIRNLNPVVYLSSGRNMECAGNCSLRSAKLHIDARGRLIQKGLMNSGFFKGNNVTINSGSMKVLGKIKSVDDLFFSTSGSIEVWGELSGKSVQSHSQTADIFGKVHSEKKALFTARGFFNTYESSELYAENLSLLSERMILGGHTSASDIFLRAETDLEFTSGFAATGKSLTAFSDNITIGRDP